MTTTTCVKQSCFWVKKDLRKSYNVPEVMEVELGLVVAEKQRLPVLYNVAAANQRQTLILMNNLSAKLSC